MRIELRKVQVDDVATFYEHQADPVAADMVKMIPRDADAYRAHWSKIFADETSFNRSVVVDGKLAGNVVCFLREGRRELGYMLGREWWGKGIATVAVREFLRDVVHERPLWAYVWRGNVGSLRVVEKCGFVVEGTEVENHPVLGDVELVVLALTQPR